MQPKGGGFSMFNVVLVDDEVISRIGITNMIDWEAEGLNLIRTFENGKEALEYLLENPIDILITDLKMPIMDGLELLEQLQLNHIHCQSIILTAFDDFQFVKQAFKFGASDYLRKLDLNKAMLLDVLTLAKEKITPEEMTPPTFNAADFLQNKRAYIKDLMYGTRAIDENFLTECTLRELEFPFPNIYVLLISIQNTLPQTNTRNIIQMLDDTLSDSCTAYATWTGIDEIGIIFNTPETGKQQVELEIQKWANRIQFVFKQYFNYSLIIYASELFPSIYRISTAYLQVHQTKHNKNYAIGENLIFYSEVMERQKSTDSLAYETAQKSIAMGLSQNNPTIIESALMELIVHLKKSKYIEIQHFYYFSTNTVTTLRHHFNIEGSSLQQQEQVSLLNNLPSDLHKKSDFIAYIEQLNTVISTIFASFAGNHIVSQAKNYINTHYAENINFQALAENLNVSSNYLSMLYKKVTGETLKDYHINLRITHAKQMLRSTTMQISDISREVGYDNEQYFSRIFKQKVGKSPSSFRNK